MRQILFILLTTFFSLDSYSQTADGLTYQHLPDTIKLTTATPEHIKYFLRVGKKILDTLSIPNAIIYRQDGIADSSYQIRIALKGQTDWTVWTLYYFSWDDGKANSGGYQNNRFSFSKVKMCDTCADLLSIDFSSQDGHQSGEAGWSETYGSTTLWDINKRVFFFCLTTADDYEIWAYGDVDSVQLANEKKIIEVIKPTYEIFFQNGLITIKENLLLINKTGNSTPKEGIIYKYKLADRQLVRVK